MNKLMKRDPSQARVMVFAGIHPSLAQNNLIHKLDLLLCLTNRAYQQSQVMFQAGRNTCRHCSPQGSSGEIPTLMSHKSF